MQTLIRSLPLTQDQSHKTFYGVTDSFDGFVLAALAAQHPQRSVLHVCRHEARLALLAQELEFLAPAIDILVFPAWDCLPYDRLSPKKDIIGKRVETLVHLLKPQTLPRVILASAASFFQRVPPRIVYQDRSFRIAKGERIDRKALENYFLSHGFSPVMTVREPGEFSLRGGIIDFFPASHDMPYRLDFFGEEVEELKTFDPLTQRSQEEVQHVSLSPVHEVLINDQTITHFRKSYRQYFGAAGDQDPLYQAISAGRTYPGAEHWLPLFYDTRETLLDYVRDPVVCFDQRALEAAKIHLEQVREYYEARIKFKAAEKEKGGLPYHPLPPELLYPSMAEMEQKLENLKVFHFSPFAAPSDREIDLAARPIADFSASRHRQDINLFDHVRERILTAQHHRKKVILSCVSTGSQNRFLKVLAERELTARLLSHFSEIENLDLRHVGLIRLPLEYGFETPDLVLMTEQDILGERQTRPTRRQRRSDLLIGEVSSLSEGDYVVHQEHGISQFKGLLTLSIEGVPHDCVALAYEGGDKLFVPVENLDVLSRYGGESSFVTLDKLGSGAWQSRKAKIRKRLLETAQHLIALAAERQLRAGEIFQCNESLYQEFVARFPYTETEDQARAIEETLEDLRSGKPMDRLICGDVGFGKTEVALRAAFVVAAAGKQVAIIAPTTLLCQQHFRHFQARFQGLGLHIEQLSRLVSTKDTKLVKERIAKGTVDVIIGTHSLLSATLHFKNLGLVIVDEEQHFGVRQKERLKELQKDVHLLTLSATPIPRTLQMALSGVRDLSLITTPPVDRLAVRTFVMPFDPVVIREAILREIYRGGQVFYVSPRVDDLQELAERLRLLVPEARAVIAHGQLSATVLEQVMNDFYDKKYEILLSTNIIESGLDMPSVNTMIIHRADLFGLAQLYQLRGRVGRAKVRGYAYLTLPERQVICGAAQKRLEVMQTLDTLGAGLQLASHDMDIRGAGNLLGEEQSGHIREVGVELYQQMLEEAVNEVRENRKNHGENYTERKDPGEDEKHEKSSRASWSPQLNLGLAVMIPDTYVSDLSVRLNLYRRLATLETEEDIHHFEQELMDRFGALPETVMNLLDVLTLKQFCRKVGVEKIDAGNKGCAISFFNQSFSNPGALIHYITQRQGTVRLRPDQKLVFLQVWKNARSKVEGVRKILEELASMAL